jgi:hypothetical protein
VPPSFTTAALLVNMPSRLIAKITRVAIKCSALMPLSIEAIVRQRKIVSP